MKKHIRLNAFALVAASHLSAGMWRHPRDKSRQYNDIETWIELVKILERGKFDGLFLADGIGMYDVYRGSVDHAIALGAQFPSLDPVVLVSALARETTGIGFGITSSVSYEPPFTFARRMSTLDHLTNGRVGWNIVTSFGDIGAKALGRGAARAHGDRYDLADEYMSIVYALWEKSWGDGAIQKNSETGVFTDPEKVKLVTHHGRYFDMEARHTSEPSPQRTPLLYQAGSSTRGRAFAARHAECVFVSAPSKRVVREIVTDVRAQAKALGRDPADILFFALMTVIPGRTQADAEQKLEEYREFTSKEGTLTLFSGWTGIDLSRLSDGDVIEYVKNETMQSTIEGFTIADPSRKWTLDDIVKHAAIGGKGPVVVGDPTQVADEFEAWIEETDIDGFNLSYAVLPESFEDFVDLVVPELQRRNIYKTDYADGVLREKLYGPGRQHLPADHPGLREVP